MFVTETICQNVLKHKTDRITPFVKKLQGMMGKAQKKKKNQTESYSCSPMEEVGTNTKRLKKTLLKIIIVHFDLISSLLN